MKKGLALLLALVLAVGLLGCGSAAGEDSRLTLARKALPDEPELPAAFMLLAADYDYRFVDKNGSDMAG